MAHLTRGAVAVIGHGLNDDCNAGGTVAFVDDLLVVIGIACTERLINGALDIIVRHIRRFCLGDDRSKAGIVIRVAAAAFLDGDDHFARDLGERLSALCVGCTLSLLYIMPFGMSGHIFNSSLNVLLRINGNYFIISDRP